MTMHIRDSDDAQPNESLAGRDPPGPLTEGKAIGETDPVRLLGTDPVDTGDTDASIAHDRYLYGLSAHDESDEWDP